MRALTADRGSAPAGVLRGKTLIAYRRAAENAANSLDRSRAQRANAEFIAWLVDAARANPTRRNIAVALWAAADEDSTLDEQALDRI